MEIQEKSCGCIIVKDNKVLLIRHNKGHWGFPKGHMEDGETEVQTAIREVKEETGLDVKIDEDKRLVEEYITDKGRYKQVVYYEAVIVSGSITIQEEELSDARWFDFEEAKENITYKETKDTFKKFLANRKD